MCGSSFLLLLCGVAVATEDNVFWERRWLLRRQGGRTEAQRHHGCVSGLDFQQALRKVSFLLSKASWSV